MLDAGDAVAAMVLGFGLCCLLWLPAYMFERSKDMLRAAGYSE